MQGIHVCVWGVDTIAKSLCVCANAIIMCHRYESQCPSGHLVAISDISLYNYPMRCQSDGSRPVLLWIGCVLSWLVGWAVGCL